MSAPQESDVPAKGQFLVYQAEDGQVKIDVRLEGETAWLTQAHMAELFQTTVPNISMYMRNIFAEGELMRESVVKDFLTTAADGKNYQTKYYNLDAIISVGYRVKSAVATRFRIWATQKLREFIVKGFGQSHRIKAPTARSYTSLGHRPRLAFVKCAKGQRPVLFSEVWVNPIGTGLQPLNVSCLPFLGRCPRLIWGCTFGAGKISHEMARELAEVEYEKFHRKQVEQADQAGGDFDKAIKRLPTPPKRKKGGGK